jgi:cell division protein FtsW (lipid II flippase)
MIFERRLTFHIDWALVGAILALAGIGLLMIYSTTYNIAADQPAASSGRSSRRWCSG